MNKQLNIVIAILIAASIGLIPCLSAAPLEIINHKIIITDQDDVFQVSEQILITSESFNNTSQYLFILPDSGYDPQVTIDKNIQIDFVKSDNKYIINLSQINSTKDEFLIEISYYIPSSEVYFKKTFLTPTSMVTVTFDDSTIFSSDFQQQDASIQIKLSKMQPPDSFNLYSMILIILLVIIIIVTAWYAFYKKKNGKGRQRNIESSELLEIEKTLLLNVLKEIEKMHRNQKISDDTYHKLKGFYKQQTVDIMSSIEEQKS